MKKKVIAYLHTHWDREWYREFEVFRLRLLRVFDKVLNLLEENKIPCFYFDGQTCALQDYLQINPEKEKLVRKLIKEKKLFIGPFYTLVDEFLTDEVCFRKNLELGLDYAKSMGCEDFIGYFADTFGHSVQVTNFLKEYNIDKAVVWRGCPEEIPSDFLFNGVKTVNLVRGYFNDFFSTDLPIEEKAKLIEENLDKIAKKSSDTLLMPIGADHLGIEADIVEQVKAVNKQLKNYEIKISSPFEYFELVKNEFKYQWDKELRDNSTTFVLTGCYSARIDIKQYSSKASYMLDLANKFQNFAQKKYKTKSYDNVINYAYKLLLENLAHDGICGCATDAVHRENILKYEKIMQVADTIIKEIIYETGEDSLVINLSNSTFTGVVAFESSKKFSDKEFEMISKRNGFENDLLFATRKIPVTEDYKELYTYLTFIENKAPSRLLTKTQKTFAGNYNKSDLKITKNKIENSKISLTLDNGQIDLKDKIENEFYPNFIEFIDFKDNGDTYNFGPVENDKGKIGKIISSKVISKSEVQSVLLLEVEIKKMILNVEIRLNRSSHLIDFKINWNNTLKNHLLQVRFNLEKPITKTFSQNMGELVERDFDPNYDIRKNLPKTRGIEAKTNIAPMQKYLWTQGFEVITKGLFEYEVFKNHLMVTLCRSTGVISNPKNPARSTPAGPPIELVDAQLQGEQTEKFSIGFSDLKNWKNSFDEVFPYIIVYNE